ncbi:uncharacterized protein RB166_018196 [Leptodactylus fuscus]|uniref:uncharacterized protein LOC142219352 isoform X2 n=1 Tax=Leptodactylus fuscus TaxID=238119 RepID=UPI003F4EF27E
MDVDSGHLSESALKLALEIMYLLTGEVYIIIKKLGERTKSGGVPHVSEGWNLDQNTLMVPSPNPNTNEKNNNEKILKLIKKIIALLTREVPIRCQDVTVYFSMEEWEYIEGHKDLYRDVVMEDQQPLGGSGRRRTDAQTHPSLPHYHQQAKKENHNGAQDRQVVLMDGVLKRIKVEVEDSYQTGPPHPCKEEEVPTAICPETSSSGGSRHPSAGYAVSPSVVCKAEADTDYNQTSSPSHQHPPRPESMFRDLTTYTERSRMNDRILELTKEIIHLLSKGDYVILKSSGDHVIPNSSVHCTATSPSSAHSPSVLSKSMNHDLQNDQKILEVANKLNELLTGEVPMRCQDVTVYFTVEEWEYFTQHKDLYMKRTTSPCYRTSQGFVKKDAVPARNPPQNTPQGDTDFSDSEETVSDSEDYEDDESLSETETEDEVPLSKINDPDLQVLLNRLRKMVKESEDYNPQCFQNDPEWGPGC